MTEEDIIKMLRAALDSDKVDTWGNGFWTITNEELKRYAKFVEIATLLDVEKRIEELTQHSDPVTQAGATAVLRMLRIRTQGKICRMTSLSLSAPKRYEQGERND